MLTEFNSSKIPNEFINELYNKPVRFVEELAILETNTHIKSFSGYFNSENFNEFLLLSENTDGTKSCFFYPETASWGIINLKNLFNMKIYLQTNDVGKKMISSLGIPFIIPHSVFYFSFNPKKHLNPEINLQFKIDLKKDIVDGKLKSYEINYMKEGKEIGFVGSNLINSKTAMIGIEVSPKWREQGIAKNLLSIFIKKLLDHNIEPVYACDRLNVPSYQLASHFFDFLCEYTCLFINDWTLDRPENVSSALPDSIFVK